MKNFTKCKCVPSGRDGWRANLVDAFGTSDRFKELSKQAGKQTGRTIHARLGFTSAMNAWNANPKIQGGTNYDDFKIIIQRVRKPKVVPISIAPADVAPETLVA